jgi:hypothetical protein
MATVHTEASVGAGPGLKEAGSAAADIEIAHPIKHVTNPIRQPIAPLQSLFRMRKYPMKTIGSSIQFGRF